MIEPYPKMFLAITLVCVFGLFFHLYSSLVTKPRKLQSALRKQGINGPQPKFILGNILEMKKSCEAAKKVVSNGDLVDSHNCGATIFPFFDQWQRQYGVFKFCYLIFFIYFDIHSKLTYFKYYIFEMKLRGETKKIL